MKTDAEIPLLEEILAEWKQVIGADYQAYRNHVYRVVHFCTWLHACSAEDREKIVVAACFHDIGIWTAGTLDYLPPSVRLAGEYLVARGREAWVPEVTLMIDMHHKVGRYEDPRYPLVEPFRRADIADFSLGLFRMGVPAEVIAQVKAAFPNAGFHKRLAQLGARWLARHPLNPLPMFRA